jgi:hypothetical protein
MLFQPLIIARLGGFRQAARAVSAANEIPKEYPIPTSIGSLGPGLAELCM